MSQSIEFWYDFASSYSYLSAMRIRDEAYKRNIGLSWRPFLLGPIFQSQGWNDSPFNIYPEKGRYMVRDIERICLERGLPFGMPERFPANSLYAARLALQGMEEGWGQLFTQKVFAAEFGDGADIGDRGVLGGILEGMGMNAGHYLERINNDDVKQALKDQTSWARSQGIFGAPTFVTGDGEIFWGDDRLDAAFRWAQKGSS